MQARIRGNILMALSNRNGALVLTTGNKSELAVGYCTLYGDMSGGLAVIGDVLQDDGLSRLALAINRASEIIPASIHHQAAVRGVAAEPDRSGHAAAVRRARRDPQALHRSGTSRPIEIVAEGFDAATVRRVLRLVRPPSSSASKPPPA